jgi:filamentous hemagglutinin family protein
LMKSPHLLIVLLIISLSINAEITTDGSLGSHANLPGPDYLIGADLGQQMGGNLFHSFKDFNLNSSESATFSGPDNVQNILSRVTGGNPSNIDGLIRSTIPNADMYFLNPYGIMFGSHVQLDIQGSFHASTADYLRLGEGGRFDARNPSDSLLTIAPVEAFGFLTDSPTSITTQDSDLSVSNGNTLSLIGGELAMNGNSPVVFDEQGFMAVFARSKFSASAGRINLASVASPGEVIPSEFGLGLNAEGGKITANNTLIDVSGRGSGGVFIRGGQLVMQDSVVQASTLADLDGKSVDMQLTESISISGNLVSLLNSTFGSGDASSLFIKTPTLTNTSWIASMSLGSGKGADMEVEVDQIRLENGGSIASSVVGSGQSGHLYFKVKEIFSLSGQRMGNVAVGVATYENFPSVITTATFSNAKAGNSTIETDHLQLDGGIISADSFGIGDAGEINIHANTAKLTNGAFISSTSFVQGKGGKINMLIDDTLSVSGQRLGSLTIPFGPTFENNDTGINSATFSTGDAGQILVEADTLLLANEGDISTSTLGKGSGGQMVIKSNNLHLMNKASISSSTGFLFRDELLEVNGKGGDVIVQANHLTLSKGSSINSVSIGKNDAGSVTVQADTIHLEESQIGTAAKQAAGGNITIKISDLLYLRGSEITTSVAAGKGSGGNITIEKPTFVVMNGSRIIAQADAGHGGNIHIVGEQFIKSPDSLISASSRLGLDGVVHVDSPDIDVSGALLGIPAEFFDASNKLKSPCTIAQIQNPSTFIVKRVGGSAPLPSDWQSNQLVLIQPENEQTPNSKTKTPSPIISSEVTEQLALKVALLTGCQSGF